MVGQVRTGQEIARLAAGWLTFPEPSAVSAKSSEGLKCYFRSLLRRLLLVPQFSRFMSLYYIVFFGRIGLLSRLLSD
jgi:hypothetical protein